MLTKNELNQFFRSHELSQSAIDYINNVRNSEPSRRVGSHSKNNVCSWIVSKKMQSTISTESRSAERAFFTLSEYDDSVYEIWDQPEAVDVVRHMKSGKKRRGYYNSDFLILRKNGVAIVEVKTKDEIERLIKDKKQDWVRTDSGSYTYLPAQCAFERLGLRYEVFVYCPSMAIRIKNLQTILKVREIETETVEVKTLEAAFEESCYMTLSDLKNRTNEPNYTRLITSIDRGLLHAKLNSQLLTNHNEFNTALSSTVLEYLEDNKCDSIGETDRQKVPSHTDASIVLAKLEKIKSGIKSRSVRRWKKLIQDGERVGLSAFQSLLPKFYRCGNRTVRINATVEDNLEKFLVGNIDRLVSNKRRLYVEYLRKARTAHPESHPVSEVTFRKRISQKPQHELALAFGGKRLGNSMQSPSSPSKRLIPSQLPWESASIDHCLCKVYLVVHEDDEYEYVAQPWLTMIVDNYRRRALSFSLSFKAPSKISCARAIRNCVRKHGKLPAEIICDRGPDFNSVFMESLLAHYQVTYSLRPTAHSRYGSEVEGYFNVFNKLWLSQRPGYKHSKVKHRGIDRKKLPDNFAVLSIEQLSREIEEFNQWYENCPQSNFSISVKTDAERKEANFPFIAKPVEFNNELIVGSAIDTNNFKLDMKKGIYLNRKWYWASELRSLQGRKSSVEVRIDCDNPHVIFVLIDNAWHACTTSKYQDYLLKSDSRKVHESTIMLDANNLLARLRLEAEVELAALREEYDLQDNKSTSEVFPEQGESGALFDSIRAIPPSEVSVTEWEDSI